MINYEKNIDEELKKVNNVLWNSVKTPFYCGINETVFHFSLFRCMVP